MGTIIQQPIACFAVGALLPTIAYFLLNRGSTKNRNTKLDVGDDDSSWADESDSDDDGIPLVDGVNPSASWGLMDAPYKMVLCVNTSLGMGKGMCYNYNIYIRDYDS